MSDQILIRPDVAAAGYVYGQRRIDELLRQRAQHRADELDRLERKIAVIDLDLALTRRARLAGNRERPRRPRLQPGQPARTAATARAQTSRPKRCRPGHASTQGRSWGRRCLVRTFNTPVRVR